MPDEFQHVDHRPPPDPLARALAGLEPALPAISRDRLMFAAGAESRAPVVRLWQLTAGLLAAVGFAAGLNWRSPVVVVQGPEPRLGGLTPPARQEPEPPELPAEPSAATPPTPARVVVRPREAVEVLRARGHALAVVLHVLPDWNRYAAPPPARPE